MSKVRATSILSFLTTLVIVTSASCGSSLESKTGQTRNDIIRGEVVHIKPPHSLQEDFVSTKDARIVVEIIYAPSADSMGEVVWEQSYMDDIGLPFVFEIPAGAVDFIEANANDYEGYYIFATVYNHVGDESEAGDLITETFTSISPYIGNVKIEVSGLEPCNSPNAGGFCASN